MRNCVKTFVVGVEIMFLLYLCCICCIRFVTTILYSEINIIKSYLYRRRIASAMLLSVLLAVFSVFDSVYDFMMKLVEKVHRYMKPARQWAVGGRQRPALASCYGACQLRPPTTRRTTTGVRNWCHRVTTRRLADNERWGKHCPAHQCRPSTCCCTDCIRLGCHHHHQQSEYKTSLSQQLYQSTQHVLLSVIVYSLHSAACTVDIFQFS